MPGKDKWFSTKVADRHRKPVQVTLSDEARQKLNWLTERRGATKSEIVEGLILREVEREDGKR